MSTADLFGGDANPDSLDSAATRAAELREPEQALPVDVSNRLRKALNERLGINLPYIA